MIKITLFESGYAVKGHANSAEYGRDIVCAAISILALTGAEALKDIYGYDAHIESGNVSVYFNPNFLYEQGERTNAILDTIKTGFQLVANEYPKYVTIIEER